MKRKGMVNFIRSRLSVKLSVFVIFMVSVFGVILYGYLDSNLESHYESEKRIYTIYGENLLKNLSENVVFELWSGQTSTLDSKVKTYKDDALIDYIVIYNTRKEPVYTPFLEKLRSEGIELPELSMSLSGTKVHAFVVEPIHNRPYLDFQARVVVERSNDFVGYVRMGIPMAGLEAQLDRARRNGYSMMGIMALCGLILILLIQRRVMPPINSLVTAASKIGKGDLEARVEVDSIDEIGMLAETFNEMAANIMAQTRKSENMIENIADAIMMLNETTSHLMSITTEQASGATEQATVVEEVVTTTEEISATANRITETAASVSQAAEETSQAAFQGKEFMDSSVAGMERIREQVERANEQVTELVKQAKLIGGIIDIIDEISEQTNLLALNASIEAAAAGESGKRFSVVANEVRHLASRTMESTELVRGIVETVGKSTNSLAGLSEDQQTAVEEGVDQIQRMGEYFQHILDMVETTRSSSSEIGLITRQQATATTQMVTSIREVEEVAKEVEKGVKEVEDSMSDLTSLASLLKTVISEKEEKDEFSQGSAEKND